MYGLGILCLAGGMYCLFALCRRSPNKQSAVMLKTKEFNPTKFLEFAVVTCLLLGLGMVTGYIFYRSLIMSLLLGGMFQVGHLRYVQYTQQKAKRRFELEFLEVNQLLGAELYSGKSLINAYGAIEKKLSLQSQYQNGAMVMAIRDWQKAVSSGQRLEEAMLLTAREAKLEDMDKFARLLSLIGRSGGSQASIIHLTNSILSSKHEQEREIKVLISEKKLEQVLLSLAPFGLVYALTHLAPDLIEPLYSTVGGRVVMTMECILLFFCIWWSNRIVEASL